MKTRHRLRQGLLILAAGAAVLPALAAEDCDVPPQRWQPREAVLQMAARQGWNVSRLKIDDGCYELRGTDARGRRFKAKLDPETLQPVRMKLRDPRDKQRAREHERAKHENRQDRPSAGRPASGAATPFTPGTAPRGQIE